MSKDAQNRINELEEALKDIVASTRSNLYRLEEVLKDTVGNRKEPPEQDQIRTVQQGLIREGSDPDLVDIQPGENGPVVSTREWLENETWKEIHRVMKSLGLSWVSDGSNSHWAKEVPRD